MTATRKLTTEQAKLLAYIYSATHGGAPHPHFPELTLAEYVYHEYLPEHYPSWQELEDLGWMECGDGPASLRLTTSGLCAYLRHLC